MMDEKGGEEGNNALRLVVLLARDGQSRLVYKYTLHTYGGYYVGMSFFLSCFLVRVVFHFGSIPLLKGCSHTTSSVSYTSSRPTARWFGLQLFTKTGAHWCRSPAHVLLDVFSSIIFRTVQQEN